jgi:hypothetical protein
LALSLNVFLASYICIQKKTFNDPLGLLVISGVLTATFACDLRGIMRRYKVIELRVKNIKSALQIEAVAATASGFVIGLPLLLAVRAQVTSLTTLISYFVAFQSCCALLGLLAGTLFVPGAGETGNQFFAGILAMTAILAFPKLTHLSDVAYVAQVPAWLAGAAVTGLVIYATEQLRRRNYGRV